MNKKVNRLIIVSIIILVVLVFFTVLLGNVFKKKDQSSQETPIPTQSFESSRTITKASDNLSSQDQDRLDFVIGKDDVLDEGSFSLGYSKDTGQYIVSGDSSNLESDFASWLQDNSLSDIYNKYPNLFVFTKKSVKDFKKSPQSQTGNQNKDLKLLVDLMKTLLSFNLGSSENQNNNQEKNYPTVGGENQTQSGSGSSSDAGSWVAQYGNSSQNMKKAAQLRSYIQNRWPNARYAGNCACRHQRGTGSDPNRWSVHSWCGAIDFFGPVSEINSWANSSQGKAMGVVFSLIDASPGDVHVQIVPNQPESLVPQCAGG